MKTIKRLVIAWFVMSAIFEVVEIILFAYYKNSVGVFISSALLFMVLSIMTLCIRGINELIFLIETNRNIKP